MDVKSIAVIGAGTMGRGIAHAAALGGFRTVLEDVQPEQLAAAQAEIHNLLVESVERGKVSPQQKAEVLALLSTAGSVDAACREADLIVETVPEDLEMKIDVFCILEKFARPGAILATNTSLLSITEIAAVTSRPERCIGLHFFNPVPKMELLEIVRALETSDETVAACSEVGARLGKEVVVIRESPGLITGRLNAMIGNEAFYMLEEGVASARDIDTAVKFGLNHPMGPFELVDLVGLDVRLSILEYLHKTLGEKFRPCPLLVQHVKAGRLGRKSGRGVFEYREMEKKAGS